MTNAGLKPRVPVEAMQFANVSQRESWIKDKGMEVFSLFHPDNPALTVDLFVYHPIPFEEMWSRSVVIDLGETQVRICSIDDLITLKQKAGRHKDLADIEQLAKIKEYGEQESNK